MADSSKISGNLHNCSHKLRRRQRIKEFNLCQVLYYLPVINDRDLKGSCSRVATFSTRLAWKFVDALHIHLQQAWHQNTAPQPYLTRITQGFLNPSLKFIYLVARNATLRTNVGISAGNHKTESPGFKISKHLHVIT